MACSIFTIANPPDRLLQPLRFPPVVGKSAGCAKPRLCPDRLIPRTAKRAQMVKLALGFYVVEVTHSMALRQLIQLCLAF